VANAAWEFERAAHPGMTPPVPDQALDVLLRCLAGSVGADTAIVVAGADDAGPRLVASWTREGREPKVSWTSGSLIGHALESECALAEASNNGDGGHRAVAAPVSSHESVIGAICAEFEPVSNQPLAKLLWTAECYARLAALCMSEDDVAVGAALGSTSLDPLTGCLSYGALIEVLKAEVQRSQRSGHRLSVCMIDLDGFKRVNDERGHIEGNRVLAAAGHALRSAARRYDTVGRFGGDEFVIVLPETGGRDRARVGERILGNVRTALATATTVPLDASIGIAQWDGEASSLEFLEAADRVMREAKGTGGARALSTAVPRARGRGELSRFFTRPFRAQTDGDGNGGEAERAPDLGARPAAQVERARGEE
jgi:diguanylate cyclase (GGDEF)-like protein